jgi:GH15 family glucan-1,4-alpha-glucosidase
VSTATESGGRPIADYALLSDCHSSALVSSEGSIDWACLRRFDGPSTFAHLLDPERGGRAFVEVDGEVVERRRRYRQGTMILETELVTPDATLRITDAFAMRRGGARDPHHQLIRRVEAVDGPIRCRLVVEPRFDYGAARPWLRSHSPQRVSAIAAEDAVLLDADVELVIDRSCDRVVADLELAPGATGSLVMSARAAHLRQPGRAPVPDADALLDETTAWWHRWSSATCVEGEFAELLERSALVLKSLCCAPTGGIVAAPTTSLPEIPGGAANWDYRYCWVRDSTFTLYALMLSGFHDEARAWRQWLLRAVAGRPQDLQILYGLHGERRVPEMTLDWLPGYRQSRPVRVGNAAGEQRQIDVYGELLDVLHLARRSDPPAPPEPDPWPLQRAVLDYLETIWTHPDHSLWEVRGPQRHYTHSKVMAWVAFDRAAKAVQRHGLPGPGRRWRRLADRIHAEVCREAFDRDRGTFVQAYGSTALDAGLLMLPLVGFLPATDERMRATVAAIEQDLLDDGLVLRYRADQTDDGLTGPEGAFLACSFWLADNYALQGRRNDAEELFGRLVDLSNDVGLLSEEYDTHSRELVGNFPQALTHVALINTARNLSTRGGPAHHRADAGAEGGS